MWNSPDLTCMKGSITTLDEIVEYHDRAGITARTRANSSSR
jgi:hypothetical protein